jgi:hypothetical protein
MSFYLPPNPEETYGEEDGEGVCGHKINLLMC